MFRHLLQLSVVLAPVAAFAWWVLAHLEHLLSAGDWPHMLTMLLCGLAILTLIETAIFKYSLLPRLADAVCRHICAGNYLPDDDPVAALAQKITTEHRPELLPELTRLVQADPRRTRAWLELARLLEDTLHDTTQAVDRLLEGAAAVRRPEDAALLTWRAITLLRKRPELAAKASDLLHSLAEQFPRTAYGKLALKELGHRD